MKIAGHTFTATSVLAILAIFIAGCGSSIPDFKYLVATDPGWLITNEDSLLQAHPKNEKLIQALITVHLAEGDAAYQIDDWELAASNFERVLMLAPRHQAGRYGHLMSKGKQYFKKGGPNDLWEAIIKFGEAAVIDTAHGEPHYWLARSYEKKDENDFGLIIEAYDFALSKKMSSDIKRAAEEARIVVLHRQEVHETFWK